MKTYQLILEAVDLVREIILTRPLPVNIGGRTVQTAAKRAHIDKRHRNNFKSELVKLLHLFDFLGINTNRLWVQHQRIHGQPLTAE